MDDFLIDIISVQRNGEYKEEISVKIRGKVRKINDKIYVSYNEYEGKSSCSCVIKTAGDKKLSVTKSGSICSKLVLEKGKKHYCPYSTKEGTFVFGVFTDDIKVKYTEEKCDIKLKYSLDVNSRLISRNEIFISAQKVEKGEKNMYILDKTMFEIRRIIAGKILDLYKDKFESSDDIPHFEIEIPADNNHGNLSSNVAMVSAKILKEAPRKIAERLVNELKIAGIKYIQKIEVAGPGFINFFLDPEFFSDVLKEINNFGESYGNLDYGQNKRVMVEFVSANPTGPMHLGNARGGALGDCLASVLSKAGFQVYKEFYVNDAGNQIEKFGKSLDVRYRQICGGDEEIQMPEDCYQGQDITDLAREFFEINGNKYIDEDFETRKKALVDFALPKNISRMKRDMEKYKIFYDKWFYESELHNSGEVKRIINLLKEKGYTYEKDGCIWYKATELGSEKDEVLVRTNGIPTYFAADIAYHYNKFVTRGFDICIDVWGADHHGHVERMKGAMEALGIDRNRLEIILIQLVRLMKNGEIIRMSKRTGKAIELSDLIEEVGAEPARFIFNTQEPNSGMDFDLDLAVKQDAQNPVYYVQYAHARICNVFKQLSKEKLDYYKNKKADITLLSTENEKNLIYFMANYPSEILRAAQKYNPTKITRYVITLATLFHKFYSSSKIISENENLTCARLCLCKCAKIIIKNVLDMFGVSAPENMIQEIN